MARPDAIDTPIYAQAHYILSLLVDRSPDALFAQIGTLLETTLVEIEATCRGEPDDTAFTVQQQKLHIIKACFHRFGERFHEFGVRTAQLLFTLMRYLSATIWEDALLCLIYVVSHLRHSAREVYSTERMSNLIGIALRSESPSIITNTVLALSRFYDALLRGEGKNLDPCARDLVERLPHSFQLITECLNNTRFTDDFFVGLLFSLAAIISAASKWIAVEDRLHLFEIYSRAWQEVQIGTGKSMIAHANLVFNAVFKGFAAVFETYSPSEGEDVTPRAMKRTICTAPKKFLAVGVFTAEAIFAFCGFLEQYNRVYGHKGNLLLNRIVNWELLAYGYALNNAQLGRTIAKTAQMMLQA
jgi:hypothetical protein